MLIIGCDFHTRYQQIAMLDEATGELIERRPGAAPYALFSKLTFDNRTITPEFT